MRILCTREYQVSIKESFHAELKAAIASEPWLESFYEVGTDYLRAPNGTEFIFRGLRHNISSIRSLAKIDLTIVEEAEDAPEASWLALEPTVFRQPCSELWVIWNPRDKGSPVDQRYRVSPPDNSVIAELNYPDNPWFPEGLDKVRRRNLSLLDPNTYAHIWEGAYLENSDRQVLGGKWRVDEFEPGADWDGPYHGLDFGFSQDPTAGVRCWIHDSRLFIEREAVEVKLELDDTTEFLEDRIPGIAKYELLADNARPESISYLSRNGLPRIAAVKKWPGSVEDGVQHLRAYKEIIIHSRCKHTRNEARLYSHKVDQKSGQVLPDIVDAHNHTWDAIRYALGKMIRRRAQSKPVFGTYGNQD
jgi:phage terminase large subunit